MDNVLAVVAVSSLFSLSLNDFILLKVAQFFWVISHGIICAICRWQNFLRTIVCGFTLAKKKEIEGYGI